MKIFRLGSVYVWPGGQQKHLQTLDQVWTPLGTCSMNAYLDDLQILFD